MRKKVRKLLFLIIAVVLVISLTACLVPTPSTPGGKNPQNGGNSGGGDNTGGDGGNNDGGNGDGNGGGNTTDPRVTKLIAELLKAVRDIENGGDYFAVLGRVLASISPEVVEDLLGEAAGEETAALIADYYGNIIWLTSYLHLFFDNISTVNFILMVLEQNNWEIPYWVTLATGISKKQGEPVYYYQTYTFTIVGEGEYRLEESEEGLDFLFKRESDKEYLITDEAGKTVYSVTYEDKAAFCSASNYEGVILYSAESVNVGEDFAVQYYDAESGRLIRVYLDISALVATVAVQNDYAAAPAQISDGLPSDFKTAGDIYVLDTVNFSSLSE